MPENGVDDREVSANVVCCGIERPSDVIGTEVVIKKFFEKSFRWSRPFTGSPSVTIMEDASTLFINSDFPSACCNDGSAATFIVVGVIWLFIDSELALDVLLRDGEDDGEDELLLNAVVLPNRFLFDGVVEAAGDWKTSQEVAAIVEGVLLPLSDVELLLFFRGELFKDLEAGELGTIENPVELTEDPGDDWRSSSSSSLFRRILLLSKILSGSPTSNSNSS